MSHRLTRKYLKQPFETHITTDTRFLTITFSFRFHLCSSCRAVRHLPRTYFPRILNEVICGESTCVRGDGRCAQRFLPLKVILHNEGTDQCPKWRLVSIDLRTCCDCAIHNYSNFLRYINRK
uniref:CTCK domain-containing protein n=1 Tax=Angiostrongylus cantonensis TaxID=6313 RepID=A0A0K0CZL2_ANGCA